MAVGIPANYSTRAAPERAVLVGVALKGRRAARWDLKDSLAELAQLVASAGAEVVGQVTQSLDRTTFAYLGKGKLEELVQLQEELGYTLAVFNDELTPTQQRNVENAVKVKVLDRSAVILDIFARRARTSEGVLQVELAQHEYLLPRLVGQWSHLERLGGGIGTRGPGETQLETDRRIVRERIVRLKRELEAVRRHRTRYRGRRKAAGVPVVSLVGYTNAGKSTLFNALVQAGVAVEDRPFSTLDPVTRRVSLPGGSAALLTDTVGFINKLPHTLVAAFRATLEELGEADLLLHVVDISHRNAREHIQTVEDTLKDLGLTEKPKMLVLNKIDLLVDDEGVPPPIPPTLEGVASDGIVVSAARGWGLDSLRQALEDRLRGGLAHAQAGRSNVYFIG
jgi:GTP-binding protein HflX